MQATSAQKNHTISLQKNHATSTNKYTKIKQPLHTQNHTNSAKRITHPLQFFFFKSYNLSTKIHATSPQKHCKNCKTLHWEYHIGCQIALSLRSVSFKAKNPWALQPLRFLALEVPKDNIHQHTPQTFPHIVSSLFCQIPHYHYRGLDPFVCSNQLRLRFNLSPRNILYELLILIP